MKQKVTLSKPALIKLVKESVLAELDKRKVMPTRYYEIFKNRVFNAMHGSFGDVERVVKEFFRDFKDKVPNADFTLDNLMQLADDIEGGGDRTHERGSTAGGHKIKDADGWWGANMGKFLEEDKLMVTESELRKVIKESVMKALNEISSGMIQRASNKFYQKYGGSLFPGPDAKDFPRDEHGNLLYPKDMKPLAQHYRNFDQAYNDAKYAEQFDDPVTREAMEIWSEIENDVDWEMGDAQWFRDEGGHGPVIGYITVDDGWEFDAEGYGYMQGGSIGDVEVESVSFKSPDGQEGSFRP